MLRSRSFTIQIMTLTIIFFILVVKIALTKAKVNVKIESVTKDRNQKNRTIIDEQCAILVKGPSPENYFLQGEWMPFEPIDGCGNLGESIFTKFNSETKSYSFDRWSSTTTPIITLMMYDSSCTLNSKYAVLSDMEYVQAVVFIYTSDTLPTSVDMEFVKESNLSVLIVPKTLGTSLLNLTYWYRSNPIHISSKTSRTRNLLRRTKSESTEIPVWNPSSRTFIFPSSENSVMPSNIGQHNMEYAWLKTTLYTNSGPEGSGFGLVEFSLVLVVVLLTVAFVTSVVLHCYFYHVRARRERAGLDGRNGPGDSNTRELLTREQLKHLSQDQYGAIRSSSTPNIVAPGGTISNSETSETMISISDEQTTEMCQSNTGIYATAMRNDTCPICLEEYESVDILRILPCSHIYHPQCIDEWLLVKSASCPMCKYNISEYIRGIEAALNVSRKRKDSKGLSREPSPSSIVGTEATQLGHDNGQQQRVTSRWKRYWYKFGKFIRVPSRRPNNTPLLGNSDDTPSPGQV